MKVIFLGTPQFVVPTLEAIISSHHRVVAVVTQPDKPVGRSHKVVPTPVKQMAQKHNIPVFQYQKIRKDDISDLLAIDADIMVTCAYGQILGANILYAKKHGVINLHVSLLPKFRGASPIQSALIMGEKTTGVTVLKSQEGMDDGKIMIKKEIDIAPDDNAITLFDKLFELTSQMVVPALDQIEQGKAEFVEQDHNQATHCTMLTEEMSKIDFGQSVSQIVGKIKGLAIWPTGKITIDNVHLKLYNAKVFDSDLPIDYYEIGQVVIANNKQGLVLRCKDGYIEITELLPQNSKKMTAKNYLNGKSIRVGSIAQ